MKRKPSILPCSSGTFFSNGTNLSAVYCCSIVYTLYCQMERQGGDLPSSLSNAATLYGASNIVFVAEPADLPPSYASAVTAQKQHIQSVP